MYVITLHSFWSGLYVALLQSENKDTTNYVITQAKKPLPNFVTQ